MIDDNGKAARKMTKETAKVAQRILGRGALSPLGVRRGRSSASPAATNARVRNAG